MRRALGESKAGHAGTLDPLATGALIVGVGNATRLLGLITLDDKRYRAKIAFGCETETDDAEGAVRCEGAFDERFFDETFASQALGGLLGDSEQIPPAYSAISVNGKRSYDLARKGEVIELAPRRITVHSAELLSIESVDGAPVWTCDFHVSKGTYVRSLARDLGRSLESAAHLCGLERTASGCVDISSCITLEELESEGLDAALDAALDPVKLLGYPTVELDSEQLRRASNGQALRCAQFSGIEDVQSVCSVFERRLYGIAERKGDLLLFKTNFPQGIEGVRP